VLFEHPNDQRPTARSAEDRPAGQANPLRLAVLVIAGLQTLAFLVVEAIALSQVGSSESLSRSIGQGVALFAAVPFALGTLPALVLGALGRWLWVALVLAVLAVLAAVLVFARM
jgi:hypothetical protein